MTRQNQLIIGGVLVLVIVLGLIGYFLSSRSQNKSVNMTSHNKATSSNSGNTIQSSITDLFTSGATKQCTFDIASQTGGSTKGIIYVEGNKAAGNFAMTSSGKTTTTNLIRNNNTFYIWGDSLPTGIKMTMDVNQMAAKMPGNQNSTFNPNGKVNYNCSTWIADESKFNVPLNIKFTDPGAMMIHNSTTAPTTQTGTSDPCAHIADATTKTACENAMHQSKH